MYLLSYPKCIAQHKRTSTIIREGIITGLLGWFKNAQFSSPSPVPDISLPVHVSVSGCRGTHTTAALLSASHILYISDGKDQRHILYIYTKSTLPFH